MATIKRDFAAERWTIILIRSSMLVGTAAFVPLLIALLPKAGLPPHATQSHLQLSLQIAKLVQQR